MMAAGDALTDFDDDGYAGADMPLSGGPRPLSRGSKVSNCCIL
jgi:hypothetical protein